MRLSTKFKSKIIQFLTTCALLSTFQVLAECNYDLSDSTYNHGLLLYNINDQYCIYNNNTCSISISGAKYSELYISGNNMDICGTGESRIDISNSSFSILNLHDNLYKKLIIYFYKDSLSSGINFIDYNNFTVDKALSSTLVYYFDSCYFNSSIIIHNAAANVRIVFNNCVFDKQASLTGLLDSIRFNNCYIENNVLLTLKPNNDKVYINFNNIDLEKIRLDYLSHFQVYFDDADSLSRERKNAFYQRLIAKYSLENLKESERNVTIEFKYQNEKGKSLFGKFLSRLDLHWWDYGYDKQRPVYWATILVFIFYFINLILWDKMNAVYPIIDFNRGSKENRLSFFMRKHLVILIYTAFIFFSLRIEFDKLKYHNSILLLWFFIQYLTGFICLFFIVRAIVF